MLKIMLCDDNREDLCRMSELMREYQEARKELSMEIYTLNSSVRLVEQIHQGKSYDIYLLDILMPECNGIDVGRVIRGSVGSGAIIYATSSPEHALDAFSVYAGGYLLKPLERDALYQCVDHVVKRSMQKRENHVLTVNAKEGMVDISTGIITKVENISRIMRFYLEEGTVIESVYIRKPFELQLERLLQEPRYIQPHKSFVVNMQYVKRMLIHDFQMMDGSMVPISRNKLPMTKNRYLEYLLKAEQ